MKLKLLVAIGFLLIIASCSKKGTGNNPAPLDCTNVPKSFAADVNPTIQAFCNTVGCHNSGSTNGPGSITNYNEVFTSRTPIRAAIAAGTMPQSGTLSAAQKNSILCWIDSGAPNN